ncbi:hypothetical protein [Ralstonia pseudosolanacearum]|uniref:hypothetical protein n=1 Tax=Ralstonia pseudosolanacearum TaxID=1310165 RepID=UPI003CECE0FF
MLQGEFLRASQEVLNLTRGELAQRIGMKKRGLDNWYLPPESSDYRNMPDEARNKIHALLREEAEKRSTQSDWLAGSQLLCEVATDNDFVRVDWKFAKELALDFQSVMDRLVPLYAAPLAAWLSEPDSSMQMGDALRPTAARLAHMLAVSPRLFRSKERQSEALKTLPPPAPSRKRYLTFDELLVSYETRMSGGFQQ